MTSTTASTITVRILSVVGGESLTTLPADTRAVRPARFENLFRAHHGAGAEVPADVSTDTSWAGSDAEVQSAHEALVSDLFDSAARLDAMDTERPCYVLFEGAGANGEDVWSRCEIVGEIPRTDIELLAKAMVDGDIDDEMVRNAIRSGATECEWEVRAASELAQDIGLGSLDVAAQWDAIRAAYEAAAEEYLESDVDDQVECAYCGRSHVPPSAVPALDDDDAWADMAPDHADYCEWIATRAHRVEVVRVFQGDHDSSDDGWANDAYAILRDSGVWVREGVDGCCSWDECSWHDDGVEYVTMRVGNRCAARDALAEHGFVVRADTAE